MSLAGQTPERSLVLPEHNTFWSGDLLDRETGLPGYFKGSYYGYRLWKISYF